jgi:hypothetical protein
VRFDDTLTAVDTNTLEEYLFFSFDPKYGLFDVTSIKMTKDGGLISFLNKRNGELWMLKRDKMGAGE